MAQFQLVHPGLESVEEGLVLEVVLGGPGPCMEGLHEQTGAFIGWMGRGVCLEALGLFPSHV
jgi:hypothetical protein